MGAAWLIFQTEKNHPLWFIVFFIFIVVFFIFVFFIMFFIYHF